jgi:hypothetical protein
MIDLDKEYYLDVKAILNFINYSDTHNNKETEIVDRYEKDENKNFNAAEKTIREITSYGNTNMDNISYDLIKILLGQILSWGYDQEQIEQDSQTLPFGLKVAFNTLLKEKLLLEKQ